MTVGEKIKQLRENNGLSQLELSNIIGCYQHTISYWETDTGEPNLLNCILLADVFGVSLDELCCRDSEKGKHGQWVWCEDRFRCSVCDEAIPKVRTDNKAFVNETYKYCRWCGAKMDGDK